MAAAPRRKTPLRAVSADEKPPSKRLTVAQAVATGSHRDLLVSMRERIAQTVSNPECPPRDLAALTRRLQDIAKEIELMDLRAKEEAGEGGLTPDEELTAEAF